MSYGAAQGAQGPGLHACLGTSPEVHERRPARRDGNAHSKPRGLRENSAGRINRCSKAPGRGSLRVRLGIASALYASFTRRPVVLALAAGVIADGARAFRSSGFGPVDCGTVPATAGLLSVSACHTSDAITAQSLADVRRAAQSTETEPLTLATRTRPPL